MNHYDDLQRFQEKRGRKTSTFRIFISQAATREHGDWAILNQLNPGAEKPLLWRWEARSPRRCRSRCPRSVPPVQAAVAAAPTSDPVVSAAGRACYFPAGRGDRRSRTEPVRQEPAC